MGGSKKPNKSPERKCIATGKVCDKSGLIRFVIGPDGAIVPDLLEKLPGRGIWVSADKDALQTAIEKNLFSKSAKTKVSTPDDLLNFVEGRLANRVIDLISLARKSGEAITGFENVKEALLAESAVLLFQASDGSSRQKSKFKPPSGPDSYFDCLDQSELGRAFGRQYAIHVAALGGGLTDKIQLEAQKLRGLRVLPTKTTDDERKNRNA